MSVQVSEGVATLEIRQVEPASPRRPMTSLASLRARFSRDEAGAVGMIFALMAVPSVMLVGFAVDFSRVLAVRQQTQGILDGAAIAGAKAAQANSSNADTVAQAAAVAYWESHKMHIKNAVVGAETVAYSSNVAKNELTWTMTQWVQTPFLHAGSMIVPKPAENGAPAGCAGSGWQCRKINIKSTSLLQAASAEKHLEMSLMLDVTGSMSGQKILDLKSAAKDLIDIMLPENGGNSRTRVALVPFAEAVNLGTDIAPQVYGPVSTDCPNNSPGCTSFTFNKAGAGPDDWRTLQLSTSCVVARVNSGKWTDESPASAPIEKAYLRSDGTCSMVDSGDLEVNLVTPLRDNREELKSRIDKLKLSGSTAGHIGTQWAWYMLSPEFGYLYPSANRARPYGTNTLKYTVLMTDGDYNTQYCKGAEAKDSLSPKINCNGDGAESEDFAKHLCEDIKAKNITVFTVGFQTSTSAGNFLRNCASSVSHYYNATNGEALRMAFRDIAMKVSKIRLSQ